MTSYAGDPYWTSARYSGACAGCGASIARDERVFIYPGNRRAGRRARLNAKPCGCGDHHARDFAACAADEELYG